MNISVLPFPVGTLVAEFILLVFLILVESIRLFAGWKSNLTENAGGMSISVMLFIPGILGVLYFLIWQVCFFILKQVATNHLHKHCNDEIDYLPQI